MVQSGAIGLRSSWAQYVLSTFAVGVTAIACHFAAAIIDYRSVGMLFLFIISILALFAGRGPVFFAAILSALIWNFLFIPPRLTLTISNPADTFLVFLYFFVALVAGILTARIRIKDADVHRREQSTAALYALVNELSCAETIDEIASAGIARIAAMFDAGVVCYLADSGNHIPAEPHAASTSRPDSPKEWSVAEWVFTNRKVAGAGAGTLPFARARYFPLLAHETCVGVIGLAFVSGRIVSLEQEAQLQMFLHQIALAVERMHLRSERLNKTLLNSISHELRTPLATITSASSALNDPVSAGKPDIQALFIADISTAAIRLNRLVDNLLDMTRIESGGLKISKEWCDVRDLLNAVAHTLRAELAGRAVRIDVAADMPLVKLDSVLVEQALANIVLNAAQYTPENAGIFFSARTEAGHIVFCVEDEGPGFPPESIGRIFEKFYRLPGTKSGGTGLGLSIVRGFVEAHGGSIAVCNRDCGGAQFTIRLPVAQKAFSPDEVD
jgi:two-component system sensor histidine kinase KdpD